MATRTIEIKIPEEFYAHIEKALEDDWQSLSEAERNELSMTRRPSTDNLLRGKFYADVIDIVPPEHKIAMHECMLENLAETHTPEKVIELRGDLLEI